MNDAFFTISISRKLAKRLLVVGGLVMLVPQVSAQQPAAVSELSTQDEIQKFCTNIADAARDQRYLMQKQELETLQADIDGRMKTLEDRTAEYQDWLKRRNDFLQRAQAGLVDIFKTMKPDAAAPQLEEMRMEIAAAIIMQLPARQSALFLSEMDPQKAGAISTIISSASDPNTSKTSTQSAKAPS
ncbi:MotE family protein [Aliirhizobium terrae]|uniref:MotE family protein n=1 Tax=Terrirhizobium terrae TaxID=2926709 RepID=UPI0035B55C15